VYGFGEEGQEAETLRDKIAEGFKTEEREVNMLETLKDCIKVTKEEEEVDFFEKRDLCAKTTGNFKEWTNEKAQLIMGLEVSTPKPLTNSSLLEAMS
jgi:hypothetical protein